MPLAGPSVRERGWIEVPFGRGKINPVSTAEGARVVATVLAESGPHVGRIYELTGPRCDVSLVQDCSSRSLFEARNR